MHRHKNKDIKNLMSSYFNVNIYIAFIEINHIGFKDEIFENRQILEDANSMQMKNIYIFVASKGGLAQLARAFDWQSKGHRFDSDILHLKIKTLQRCKVFFIFWSAL
jgi:hypothetical protein